MLLFKYFIWIWCVHIIQHAIMIIKHFTRFDWRELHAFNVSSREIKWACQTNLHTLTAVWFHFFIIINTFSLSIFRFAKKNVQCTQIIFLLLFYAHKTSPWLLVYNFYLVLFVIWRLDVQNHDHACVSHKLFPFHTHPYTKCPN